MSSITRRDLEVAAKAIAQDAGADSAVGLKLLLDAKHYDQAIEQGLAIFTQDRPNVRVFDYTVAASGFRYALSGDDAILPDEGADAWVDGLSTLQNIWWPWRDDAQGLDPLDPNIWRQVLLPGSIAGVELLAGRPAVADVVRLQYTSPHVLSDTDPTVSSPRPGDLPALKLITASLVLTLAANKLMQNTGNTGLPSDVVDRRTQADVARSLAKDLRSQYAQLVGRPADAGTGPASGFLDLDVNPTTGRGALWHPSWTH